MPSKQGDTEDAGEGGVYVYFHERSTVSRKMHRSQQLRAAYQQCPPQYCSPRLRTSAQGRLPYRFPSKRIHKLNINHNIHTHKDHASTSLPPRLFVKTGHAVRRLGDPLKGDKRGQTGLRSVALSPISYTRKAGSLASSASTAGEPFPLPPASSALTHGYGFAIQCYTALDDRRTRHPCTRCQYTVFDNRRIWWIVVAFLARQPVHNI